MCADTFHQGLLVGIPCSFTSTGQSLWQSPVTALVFDGRTGIIIPSQISLALPNPSTASSIIGAAITDTCLFLLLSQQQADGSQPLFLSTYDFTTSPPTLLQTISAQPLPLLFPGESSVQAYGNTLFAGAGVYDISSGLPIFVASLSGGPPSDMSGPLALFGPPNGHYQLVDYSSPANPKTTAVLYNGDTHQGPTRFGGNHAYIVGSGVQILDVSSPGGQIPETVLRGSGALGVINDLLASPPNLYAAENTDAGPFVSTYDLSQMRPQKIGSFTLSNEVPFSLAFTGHFLFVGTSTELLVLDVSNPSSPVKAGSLVLPTSSLALLGNVLYAGTTDNRLVVVNVSNPASPVAGASISLAGFPVTMQANGNLLFVAADTAGLLTYSIPNPTAPALLSQFKPSSAVEGVAVDGNLVLLAAADGGLVIANMANPSAPTLAGQVPLDTLACFSDTSNGAPGLVSISRNNGIAYVGSTNMFGAVFGFDYRQPQHPRLVSAASYGDAILETISVFAFSGPNALVALGDKIFEADITQPRNFIRHMCLPPPFGADVTAKLPELKKSGSATSGWNPKMQLTKDWPLHP
jgi:hypothetical protein